LQLIKTRRMVEFHSGESGVAYVAEAG